MTTKETGGPAFPTTQANYDSPKWAFEGMSMRDYFAAEALKGMLCNGFIPRCALPDGPVIQTYDYPAVAYVLADQMLEARK